MNKFVLIILAGMVLFWFSSCAKNRTLEIEGKKTLVEPYGLFSELFDKGGKHPAVEYRLSTGNVVLSVIFSETVIVPVILCGWYLWEPVTNR